MPFFADLEEVIHKLIVPTLDCDDRRRNDYGMNIFFNNASENLVHDYLDLTTNSLLPQEIGQVAHHLRPDSLTAHALSSATTSWSSVIAQSTHACADQLHSVAAMLTRMRSDDNSLAAQLRLTL